MSWGIKLFTFLTCSNPHGPSPNRDWRRVGVEIGPTKTTRCASLLLRWEGTAVITIFRPFPEVYKNYTKPSLQRGTVEQNLISKEMLITCSGLLKAVDKMKLQNVKYNSYFKIIIYLFIYSMLKIFRNIEAATQPPSIRIVPIQ